MATLLDIVANDIAVRTPFAKNEIIKTTIKDFKEVLLAMADIADRIVTYDVGDPPTNTVLNETLFDEYFHKCMGQNALKSVFTSIENMETPHTADLNHLLARDLVIKCITNYSELMNKTIAGVAFKYMEQNK